jgi:nucleoside 2-deoxyribosyltransferase
MTDVFVAGPIDFAEIEDVVEYRLSLRDSLEAAGYTPVDQYSESLRIISEIDFDAEDVVDAVTERLDEFPDEPYLHAVQYAIAETSVQEVVAAPNVVPEYTPESIVSDIVERDLSLLRSCDGIVAYFPRPSCGTMAEMIHANECDVPSVAIGDPAPHYVQYYADDVVETVDEAVQTLEERVPQPQQ